MTLSKDQLNALWAFASILVNNQYVRKSVRWLFDKLKTILLPRITAGLEAALASVKIACGKLTLFVAANPMLCVILVGTSVSALAQLGLEKAGYNTAGRVAGGVGMALTGGAVGLLCPPAGAAMLAYAGAAGVGGLAGFGLWNLVDWARYGVSKEITLDIKMNIYGSPPPETDT